MSTSSVISRIKGVFQDLLSVQDARCKIQSLEFVTALICSFPVLDGRTKSVSTLRKSVMAFTRQKLSRSAFWERLATKKLPKLLQVVLGRLVNDVCVTLGVGVTILEALSVFRIFLLDSSSFTLPEGAKGAFPAPRNNVVPSAIKIHLLYDLFGGIVKWFEMTPATTHDRKGFPPLSILSGALIIFDLGYWDFQLLKDMIDGTIFF
jgi:hypothetical protein